MSLLRLGFCASLALAGVLALPGCDGSDGTTGPTFVTELAIQDAAGMSKQDFARGETVFLVMTVRNRSNQTIEVQPPASCADHEFMVAPMRSSDPLWRASFGIFCILQVQSITFAPLETKTFRGQWNQVDNSQQPVPAGSYEIFGTLADNFFPGQQGSKPSQLSSTLKLININ